MSKRRQRKSKRSRHGSSSQQRVFAYTPPFQFLFPSQVWSLIKSISDRLANKFSKVIVRQNENLGRQLSGYVIQILHRDIYQKYNTCKQFFRDIHKSQTKQKFSIRLILNQSANHYDRKYSLKKIMKMTGTVISQMQGHRFHKLYYISGAYNTVAKACRYIYQYNYQSQSEQSLNKGKVKAELIFSTDLARHIKSKKGLLQQIEQVCSANINIRECISNKLCTEQQIIQIYGALEDVQSALITFVHNINLYSPDQQVRILTSQKQIDKLNNQRVITQISNKSKALIKVTPFRQSDNQLAVALKGTRQSKMDAVCQLIQHLHPIKQALLPTAPDHSSDRQIGQMSQQSQQKAQSKKLQKHHRSRSRDLSSPKQRDSQSSSRRHTHFQRTPSRRIDETRHKYEIKVLVPKGLASDMRQLKFMRSISKGEIIFSDQYFQDEAVLTLRGRKSENLQSFRLIQKRIDRHRHH